MTTIITLKITGKYPMSISGILGQNSRRHLFTTAYFPPRGSHTLIVEVPQRSTRHIPARTELNLRKCPVSALSPFGSPSPQPVFNLRSRCPFSRRLSHPNFLLPPFLTSPSLFFFPPFSNSKWPALAPNVRSVIAVSPAECFCTDARLAQISSRPNLQFYVRRPFLTPPLCLQARRSRQTIACTTKNKGKRVGVEQTLIIFWFFTNTCFLGAIVLAPFFGPRTVCRPPDAFAVLGFLVLIVPCAILVSLDLGLAGCCGVAWAGICCLFCDGERLIFLRRGRK